MNFEEYQSLYELEEHFWWFTGMRRIVAALLDRAAIAGADRILDAGCGTGFNLAWLKRCRESARVFGLDLSSDALQFSRRRGEALLAQGSVAALPFPDHTFDLVLSLEVLDWFSPQAAPLPFGELARVLKKGGALLIRLPAFQFLHSAHDDAIRTAHRYTARELAQRLAEQGLMVRRVTYANTLLFPVASLWRLMRRSPQKNARSDVRPLPPALRWLNPVLGGMLGLEAAWLRHFGLPVGLSVIALAQKPADR